MQHVPPTDYYDQYFQASALEFFQQRLPWQLFKAQAIAESNLSPTAVSPCGALGVMQLMPGTARDMAAKLQIANTPEVPHVNIRMGIAYARQCWDIWQDEARPERLRFMLGSYNAGPGNILQAQLNAGRHHLPTDQWLSIVVCLRDVTGKKNSEETIKYVAKILVLYQRLSAEVPA